MDIYRQPFELNPVMGPDGADANANANANFYLKNQCGMSDAQPAQSRGVMRANCAHHRPVRLSRAKLLKRVIDLDLEHGPNCSGELKIIAASLERPVMEKTLTHLALQVRAPPRAPARGQALRVKP